MFSHVISKQFRMRNWMLFALYIFLFSINGNANAEPALIKSKEEIGFLKNKLDSLKDEVVKKLREKGLDNAELDSIYYAKLRLEGEMSTFIVKLLTYEETCSAPTYEVYQMIYPQAKQIYENFTSDVGKFIPVLEEVLTELGVPVAEIMSKFPDPAHYLTMSIMSIIDGVKCDVLYHDNKVDK